MRKLRENRISFFVMAIRVMGVTDTFIAIPQQDAEKAERLGFRTHRCPGVQSHRIIEFDARLYREFLRERQQGYRRITLHHGSIVVYEPIAIAEAAQPLAA